VATQAQVDFEEIVKGTVVYKMSASGNDFILVDGRTSPVATWSPERVQAVCARRTGIGADGVAVIEPGSVEGAIRFSYFNRDGNRAEMCGNASLCATKLAARLELAPPEGMVLETDIGDIPARILVGNGERAEIGFPDVVGLTVPDIEMVPGERSIHFVKVGVPHLVVVVDEIDAPAAAPGERGRALRSHQFLGPDGANVNFLGCNNGSWRIRTFERGVEAETLACGTGAVAAAATLTNIGHVSLPWQVKTSSGAFLEVSGQSDNDPLHRLSQPRLVGEARMILRGVLL
jgi:diaminopimelate epimerase